MSENEFLRTKPRNAKDEQLLNLLTKVVTLVTIFIGIWAGTQKFCNLVGYDPGWVGEPFYVLSLGKIDYPLYNPLLIFYWTLIYFRRTDIHHIFFDAYKIIGYTSISAIACQ